MIKCCVFAVFCVLSASNINGLKCNDVSGHKKSHLLPRKPYCGRTSWLRPPPVVGATVSETDLGEYPWLVFIQFKRRARFTKHPKWEHVKLCTGSIINYRYVISAAQYVNLSTSYNHRALVRLGDWDIDQSGRDCQGTRCAPAREVLVATNIIRNSQYFSADGKDTNDVLLLRLCQSLRFNEFIQPICLPLTCYWQAKELECYELTVAGWGFKEKKDRSVPVRMGVDMKSRNSCAIKSFTNSQLCSGGIPFQTNCKGGPWSPIMLQELIRENFTYYLMGMTSQWSCTRHGFFLPFSISTNVASFVQWILDRIDV